jgi:hypothetical protein
MITFRLAAVVCLLGAATWPAAAECAAGSSLSDAKRHTPFVFEGTVTRMTVAGGHTEAVLEAHRVWKGKVATVVSVHFVPNIDGPTFAVGHRDVVFSVSETDTRRRFSPYSSETHNGTIWVNPCSGAIPVSPKLIEQLGRSRKPS